MEARATATYLERLRTRAGAIVVETPLDDHATVLTLLPPVAPGGALALWHGGGNDRLWGFWLLIEAALSRGFAVLTAHQPGHGPGDDRFSLTACRDRLDALVAAAYAHSDAVTVLGQSMGGAFVLDRVARGAPEPAIAVSTPLALPLGPAVLRELALLASPETRRALDFVPFLESLPAFGPFRRERFPLRTDGPYIQVFRQTLAALDLEARLASIAMAGPRVRLVHGTADGIAPYAHAERLAAALEPCASLLAVPGGRHFNPLLRNDVVADLLGWATTWRTFAPAAG